MFLFFLTLVYLSLRPLDLQLKIVQKLENVFAKLTLYFGILKYVKIINFIIIDGRILTLKISLFDINFLIGIKVLQISLAIHSWNALLNFIQKLICF